VNETSIRRPAGAAGKASKRGLVDEQVPVLMAADRPAPRQRHIASFLSARSFASGFAASLDLAFAGPRRLHQLSAPAPPMGVSHEALTQTGWRACPGENCTSRPSTGRHERLKSFFRRHRGVATK